VRVKTSGCGNGVSEQVLRKTKREERGCQREDESELLHDQTFERTSEGEVKPPKKRRPFIMERRLEA